ncbi:MAG: hypothetical protein JSU86_18465 [Phycisphaerales bacterium]|nr:MAG: hypothetical protein JSU86_18465 [Phycisphaerales bacterium]
MRTASFRNNDCAPRAAARNDSTPTYEIGRIACRLAEVPDVVLAVLTTDIGIMTLLVLTAGTVVLRRQRVTATQHNGF